MRRLLRWAARAVGGLVLLVAAFLAIGHAWTRDVDADAVSYARAHLRTPIESRRVDTNGIRLHVVLAGPEDGTPVVLLHGHGDFWWGWHRQIDALADAGLRVIAPDLRGFGASDKPREVDAYRRAASVEDVAGLIDALAGGAAFVVGHDSGAAIGWDLAAAHPDRVRGFLTLGVAHPAAYRSSQQKPIHAGLITAFGGLLMRPPIPKLLLRPFDWWPLLAGMRAAATAGAFDDDELDLYRAAWSRDDAITSMSLWTLARNPPPDERPVTPPVLIVVLSDDPALPAEPTRASARYCRDARLVEIPDVGHWVAREAPERTSELIVDFVRSAQGAPSR